VKAGKSRVVRVFRFFLGIEVIEIPVKFIEAMDGGQEFVSVAEVVLANLSGGVPDRLELSSCAVFLLQSDRRARQPDCQKTGTEGMLSSNGLRPAPHVR
jgi:hypothetical protein